MKASEVKVGSVYLAKVGGITVKVKIERIRTTHGGSTAYDVVNTVTKAKTTFYSAAKFRSEVPEVREEVVKDLAQKIVEGEFKLPGQKQPEMGQHTYAEHIERIKSAEPEQSKEICDVCGGYTKRLQPGGCTCLEGEDSLPPTPATSPATTLMSTTPPMDSQPTGVQSAVETPTATTSAPTTALVSSTTKEGEQRQNPTDLGGRGPSTEQNLGRVAGFTSILANRIAHSQQTRQRGTPVAGMVPNEEQEAIIEMAIKLFGEVKLVRRSDGVLVLVVMAGAGSGKTASCKMLEIVLPGRIQYTAFNRPLVDEARPKFSKAKCSTTHQLAFHAEGKRFAHRLPGKNGVGRMRSEQIAQFLGIESFTVTLKGQGAPDEAGNPTDRVKALHPAFLAGQVMVAVQRFTQSADREISQKHFKYIEGIDQPSERENNDLVKKYLISFAQKAWTDLTDVNGKLPFSHDCYVKIWQLGEGDNRPVIASDVILLDEYQDTAPVFLDVLAQQKHALLVMVGDDNQRIYEWRGAVNAGDHFPEAPRCMLSQSYRFGQAIADVANTILAELEEPTKLRMRGNPAIPSRVGPVAEPKCFLYRTNAGAIGRVMSAVAEGKRPFLLGNVGEAIEFCKAALDLQNGRSTSHTDLGCFNSWEEVEEYVGTDEGADLKLMVKIVNQFGAQEIIDALKDMPKEEHADLVVSTAHKSKGREWDTVRLGGDFPTANKMTDPDVRLLYVAATRAKLTLDVSECPPFCGGECQGWGEGGAESKWVPGLTIRYSKPMPTQEEQEDWLDARRYEAAKELVTKAAEKVLGVEIPRAPTAEQVKQMFEAKDSAQAQQEIAAAKREQAQAAVASGTFTWTKFNDRWCFRGPVNTPIGSRVTVTRKDGSSQQMTIKEVVRRFPDAWIYS